MTNTHTRLIERWLPIGELGVEAQREGSAAIHPPNSRLHVWWARRPLTTSRAAILASLLPAWSDDLPDHIQCCFPDEQSYMAWFRQFLGIQGDPVAARKRIKQAKESNEKLKGNPYGGPRAFSVNPSEDDLALMLDLLEHTWNTRDISVLDPMSGGGSIPFEALRYGFTTYANELNPVASVILKATLDYPARFGPELEVEIRKWGNILAKKVEERLEQFFPRQTGEQIFAYIWARTVACPQTGKPVPLSPNWWLQKGSNLVAVKLHCEPEFDVCQFEIVRDKEVIAAKPDEGTVKRGVGISPWTGDIIEGDYIKREAQAGRMGQQLYAVGIKTSKGSDFRVPNAIDLEAIIAAEVELARILPTWQAQNIVPMEDFPDVGNDMRPHTYGMEYWHKLFAPRQLLALGTIVSLLRELRAEMEQELIPQIAQAVITYLAIAIDKAVDYNSRMIRWHSSRGLIAGTFDRHDFSFKWSHGEFDAAHNQLPWVINQVAKSYKELGELTQTTRIPMWQSLLTPPVERLHLTRGTANNLDHIADGAIHLICMDPPYYDNVQYAELSDFFYVWLKRTVGDIYPDWFASKLVEKDDEAVANPARFADLGKQRKNFANQDYERKMAAAFREMQRVLHPDGILTIMFTHKEVAAWDTLAAALIGAGFHIVASLPIHTESEHSLHQAKKNAAASTILLTCRKRVVQNEAVWWDDVKGKVRRVARERAAEFAAQGIEGVDLYISTFGPALSVISEQWPVLTSEMDDKGNPKPLRPEIALDLAREEVIALRKQRLLPGQRVQFDAATDWYMMAWDAFKAAEFPADEARKLALVLGLDLETDIVRQKRLVTKKQNSVTLQTPKERRKRGMVDPEAATFTSQIDAVHTAMLVYEEDGSVACDQFLKRAGLYRDATFKACLQTLINAIPRTQTKGGFVRPEAATLEAMRLAFFEDLEVNLPEEPQQVIAQPTMEL